MSNMSLSAYVFGFSTPPAPPTPPQPGLDDILPAGIEGAVSDQTHIRLIDYVERNVDIIEGDDF